MLHAMKQDQELTTEEVDRPAAETLHRDQHATAAELEAAEAA
jgi:hypothetical protein